jgi:hypothetical protein
MGREMSRSLRLSSRNPSWAGELDLTYHPANSGTPDRFDHVEPDAAERAALSASWKDRAYAARVLASRPESSSLLDRLLLDPNLAVAESAAQRLLARADQQGVTQFTSAYVRGDDQLRDHFNDVLHVAVQTDTNILNSLKRLSKGSGLGARMALEMAG